jgi:RNA polymerase sigma-70 factor, ECF subfamily
MDQESRLLVQRATQGDARAVEALLAQNLPALRAWVRLRCGPVLRDRESASDIVQSACREVLQHIDRFRWNGEAGFRAWLYATTARKIADRADHWKAARRDAAREVPLHGKGPDGDTQVLDVYRSVCTPSEHASGRETMERIERAFETLADDERELIVMSRIAGLSGADIAGKLGCSEAAARQRLFRALANLSEALEQQTGAAD